MGIFLLPPVQVSFFSIELVFLRVWPHLNSELGLINPFSAILITSIPFDALFTLILIRNTGPS